MKIEKQILRGGVVPHLETPLSVRRRTPLLIPSPQRGKPPPHLLPLSVDSHSEHNEIFCYMLVQLMTLSLILCISIPSQNSHAFNVIKIITVTIFIVLSLWQSHCESSLGSRDEYRNGGCRPLDQTNQLEPQTRLYRQPVNCIHHRHLLLLLSPKAHFRPMEGRRLSRPRWLLHTEMVYPSIDGHPSKY